MKMKLGFLLILLIAAQCITAQSSTESSSDSNSASIPKPVDTIASTEPSNKDSKDSEESHDSGHLHLHKIFSVPHGDHLHRVHHIHLLPANLALHIKADAASEKNQEKDVSSNKLNSSGKCSCDVLLLANEPNHRREHIHNVYQNQLNFTVCDAADQKQCIQFCVDKANDSQNSFSTMCSSLAKDVEKRKLALFATVECEGQAAGFLSFKKITKWTGFAYPMRLTCIKNEHKVEALDDTTEVVKKTEEFERESQDTREKLVITTQKSTDVASMPQSDDSQASGPTEEKKEEKVEEKKVDDKEEKKNEKVDDKIGEKKVEEKKEETKVENKKEDKLEDKKDEIEDKKEEMKEVKLESKKNEMQDLKSEEIIDKSVENCTGKSVDVKESSMTEATTMASV